MAYRKIKDRPTDERPREKMVESGARNLRDDELLAIMLNTGLRNKDGSIDVLTLSKILVQDFGLKGLLTSFENPQEIMEKTGLTTAKACLLGAVGEIIRRLTEKDSREINNPKDALAYFSDLRKAQQEQVQVACLSPQNIVVYSKSVAIGGTQTVDCPLINVLHPPVRFYAQRIIVAHNHPRGKAEPSDRDIAWHDKLLAAAKTLEIDVVDHIIVGKKDYFSFDEAGRI